MIPPVPFVDPPPPGVGPGVAFVDDVELNAAGALAQDIAAAGARVQIIVRTRYHGVECFMPVAPDFLREPGAAGAINGYLSDLHGEHCARCGPGPDPDAG